MNLILGTAQFGQNYGILNNSKVVDFNDAKKILNKLIEFGIENIDTSPQYGESQKFIGNSEFKKFNIITKLPPLKKIRNVKSFVDKFIEESIKDLNCKKIEGVLFHDSRDLLDRNGLKIWNRLKKYKFEGVVSKIGYSIYHPNELDNLYKKYKPDIVQAPYNIFDRRMHDSGWIDALKEEKVEFHARSIFLQGLLLMSKKQIPKKFKKWNKNFKIWHDWLAENKIKPIEGCISLVNKDSRISKSLIGVKSAEELVEIIKIWKKVDLKIPSAFSISDENILNPTKW